MQKIYQFYSDATFKDNEVAARSQQKQASKQTNRNKQKQTNIVSD